jgi:hypothetical protein
MSSLLGIDLDELLHVEKDVGELLGGEQAGHHHRPVKLLVYDPQVPPVLDLRLDDLCDDLFALAAASRAGVAQRRGQEAPTIRTAANTGKQLSVAVIHNCKKNKKGKQNYIKERGVLHAPSYNM